MALRLFSICLLLLSSVSTFAQTVLFADDFEGANSWSAIGPTINTWTIEQCAGNGNTSAGLNSMYVTNGAPDGCSASGNEAFAYSNAASGIEEAVVATLVDASCASNYQLYFDYIIEGVSTEDFVEVVYSLDGVNFTAVGAALPQTPFWNFTTISLPALLDFSSFWIGFRFTYNDANLGSIPAAIDNIALFGDDTVPPSITCPTSLELLVNSSCQAICEDMTKDMIALSDNCIDSALIVVTQDVPQFTIFPGGAGTSETITLTATDLDGNSSQCSFTLFIIDEEPPSILCPADTNVYVNGNCDGILENYL